MKRFWSYISDGKHSVGCTGGTVYVYDSDGLELAKLKDISYAYLPAISPDGRILAVKSTDGRFAVYSLEELRLIKKFRYSKVDCAQDDSFCFSKDGTRIINLERQGDCLHHGISEYSTDSLELVSQLLFEGRTSADRIECDTGSDGYYILGYESKGFVARYENGELFLRDRAVISAEEYNFYRKYKELEQNGFTEKAFEWAYMDCELEDIKNKKYTLKELYLKYKSVEA